MQDNSRGGGLSEATSRAEPNRGAPDFALVC